MNPKKARFWGTPLIAAMLCLAAPQLLAQEESAEDTKYREDYEKVMKLKDPADPVKRSENLLGFMKERPDSKVFDYAQTIFLQALESLSKAEKYPQVITLSERFIALRPRVGETYYFYGTALKKTNKTPEAIDALAKCAVTKNRAARQANEFLEYIYRQQNNTIIGLDKIKKKALAEMSK